MTSLSKLTSLHSADYLAAQVTISHCAPDKPAFGFRIDTNESVYINARLSRLVGLNVGDAVTILLTQNTKDTGNVPWYALEIQDAIFDIGFGLDQIVALVAAGGVWTGSTVAQHFGAPGMAGHASALLEVAYQRKCCNKIVEFTCATFRQDRIWFAASSVGTDLLDLSELEDVA